MDIRQFLFLCIIIVFCSRIKFKILNNKYRRWIIGFGISFIIIYCALLVPKDFNRIYNGVKFRLGEKKEDILDNITIVFQGKSYRTFTLKKRFRGTIKINDLLIPAEGYNKGTGYIDMGFEYQALNNFNTFYYTDANPIYDMHYCGFYFSKDNSELAIYITEEVNGTEIMGL